MAKPLKRNSEPIKKVMVPDRFGQFVKIVVMHGDFFVMVAHNSDKAWTMVLRTVSRDKACVIVNAYATIGYEIMPTEGEGAYPIDRATGGGL